MSVALAFTTHDLQGDLLKVASERLPTLAGIYPEIYAVPTDSTDRRLIELLESHGVHVKIQVDGEGLEHVAEARRMALREALSGNCSHIHFIDLDRVLLWATLHPEELESVAGLIPYHEFLILGRTYRAFQTHPHSQMATEDMANQVASLIMGMEVDVTGASRGLSRRSAELVLQHSKVRYFNTDSEWPLIVKYSSDMKVTWLNVQGLEFEDWLKLSEDQKTVEGIKEYKMRIDRNPEVWVKRMRWALEISETALRVYRELTSTEK